jgi:hypothetical protein
MVFRVAILDSHGRKEHPVTASALNPEIVNGVAAYLATFAAKADQMGQPETVVFAYDLAREDNAGVTDAVRQLIRQGYRVVFYADRWADCTVVAFYPKGQRPLSGMFGYRTGRRVLASYWV